MAAVVTLGQQLVSASRQGTVEQVGDLLDQGVAVDSRDGCGWTGLMHASCRGHRAIVVLLLDRGADVNAATGADGYTSLTSLMLASRKGQLDIVEVLHARGADIHQVDSGGQGALYYAAVFDRLPVCEFLLSKGADLMAATNGGHTVLGRYGAYASIYGQGLPPATLALRRAALEAAWAEGPHPSQVQRRRDERWARRGPVLWVLAEHAYRPLQLRAQAIAAAALGAPLPVVQYSPKEDVLRSEGLVRYIVAFL